jgi:hypothetical protein
MSEDEQQKEYLRKLYAKANRLRLSDGTVWPAPIVVDDFEQQARVDKECAVVYRTLITHPWGANVSCKKIRELRREWALFLRDRLKTTRGAEKGVD